MGRWVPFFAVLLLLALSPRLAAAQSVLVARPPTSDETLFEAYGRLCAELRLQGFEVVEVGDQGTPRTADELEALAQEEGAFAAIALQRNAGGTTAQVLIVDRVTGKSTTRKLQIDDSSNGPTLLAVRATDMLRASLVEFPPGEHPPEDVVGVEETPPPPEVVRFAHREHHVVVRVGGDMLVTPELGVSAGPLLGARYMVGKGFAVGLEAGGPLVGAQHETANGTATVRQERVLLRADWRTAGGPRWEWGPYFGVGAHHLEATSVVEPPLVSRTDTSWSFVASAGLEMNYSLAQTVTAELSMGALTLSPHPVIAVADEQSAPISLQAEVAVSIGVSF